MAWNAYKDETRAQIEARDGIWDPVNQEWEIGHLDGKRYYRVTRGELDEIVKLTRVRLDPQFRPIWSPESPESPEWGSDLAGTW